MPPSITLPGWAQGTLPGRAQGTLLTRMAGGGNSALAPRVGFEPTTVRLTVGCSTAELPRNAGAEGAP